jgi:2,3-dihydroxybenzoate decarboxylase
LPPKKPGRRKEILERYRKLLAEKPESWDPGFRSLWGFFLGATERATSLVTRIQDLGDAAPRRHGRDRHRRQLVFLTRRRAGVRRRDRGFAFARIQRPAGRCHPQASRSVFGPGGDRSARSRDAAKELERSVKALGFKGAVVNSHTQGEYLDEPKCWEIFEAAQALDVPIYIHPNTPPREMIGRSCRAASTARSTASRSRPACT